MTVADAQSTFDIGCDLTVGYDGFGLLLVDGDTTVAGGLFVGSESDGQGQSTVNVATLDVSGDATIGDNGLGSVLVQLAGAFQAQNVALGSSGTLTVDGNGTTAMTDDLAIGVAGQGALNVTDGAVLTTTGDASLGDAVSANVQTAKIDTQGLWSIGGDLTVGSSGIATMNITAGGNVAASDVVLGDESAASGLVTVSGAVTNQLSGDTSPSGLGWGVALTVGNYGDGSLTVEDGAFVAPVPNGDGLVQIAAQTGSYGSFTVAGDDSLLDAADTAIGGTLNAAGGAGTLTVQQGGLVEVADDVTMWNGTIDVSDGGEVFVGTNGSFDEAPNSVVVQTGGTLIGDGTINGNLVLDGGTIDADGGTLTIDDNVADEAPPQMAAQSGTLKIDANSALEIEGAFGEGDIVDFQNDTGTLILDSLGADEETSGDGGTAAAEAETNSSQSSTGSLIVEGTLENLTNGSSIILKGINPNVGNSHVVAATIGYLPGKGSQLYLQVLTSATSTTPSVVVNFPIAIPKYNNSDYFTVAASQNGKNTILTYHQGNGNPQDNPIDLAVDGQGVAQTGAGVTIGIISRGAEGVAMAEVIKDIAPNANIIIQEAPAGGVAGAVNTLVSQGANIIVDDLAGSVFDATSLLGTKAAIAQGIAKGVVFVTAAGNTNDAPNKIVFGSHQASAQEITVASMNILATPGMGSYLVTPSTPASTESNSDAPGPKVSKKPNVTGPDFGPTAIPASNTLSPKLLLNPLGSFDHSTPAFDPFAGTSAAAPAVAAVAALMKQKNSQISNAEIKQILSDPANANTNANPIVGSSGAGLVDAANALQQVKLPKPFAMNGQTQAANADATPATRGRR